MLVFIVLLHSIPVFLIGAAWRSSKMVTVIAAGISAVLAILTSNPAYSIVVLVGIVIAMWLSFVAINFSKRFAVTHRASLALLGLTKSSEPMPAPAMKPVAPQLAHSAWAFASLPLVALVAYISLGKTTELKNTETATTPASATASETTASLPAAAASAPPVPVATVPAAIATPVATPPPIVAQAPPIQPLDPVTQDSSTTKKKKVTARPVLREPRIAPVYQTPPEQVKARESVAVNFPGIDQNSQEYRWRVEKELLKQSNK